MTTPADVARMIGGIRAAQPKLGAAAIEAFCHIASGADCSADLLERMVITRGGLSKALNMLTGRGALGVKNPKVSSLRLVYRRRHPDRPGSQLLLTDNGRELISSTFALNP